MSCWSRYHINNYRVVASVNTDPIKAPEEVGLPPLGKLAKGYMVFVTGEYPYIGARKEWVNLSNGYGWAYDIKGFAINKAKKWADHRHQGNHKPPATCVVELKSGELVWASWHDNN